MIKFYSFKFKSGGRMTISDCHMTEITRDFLKGMGVKSAYVEIFDPATICPCVGQMLWYESNGNMLPLNRSDNVWPDELYNRVVHDFDYWMDAFNIRQPLCYNIGMKVGEHLRLDQRSNELW